MVIERTDGEIVAPFDGEITSIYNDPSCLVLGSIDDNKSIHVVCALEGDNIWMITSYYPAKSEWLDDFKTRRR